MGMRGVEARLKAAPRRQLRLVGSDVLGSRRRQPRLQLANREDPVKAAHFRIAQLQHDGARQRVALSSHTRGEAARRGEVTRHQRRHLLLQPLQGPSQRVALLARSQRLGMHRLPYEALRVRVSVRTERLLKAGIRAGIGLLCVTPCLLRLDKRLIDASTVSYQRHVEQFSHSIRVKVGAIRQEPVAARLIFGPRSSSTVGISACCAHGTLTPVKRR